MKRSHFLFYYFAAAVILSSTILPASAQTELLPDVRQKIDTLAADVLTKTGVPSASVAVVQNGEIAYAKAYGYARINPKIPANPNMRYKIGSISKQFTSTAILLLEQEAKLSLDDKVAKFIPDLTEADEVTIRELLSHTSGYQDYWPQDYVMKLMLQPTTAREILDLWGQKPLDFDPGTQWQYSNTNYVITGVIAEEAAGIPLFNFLQEKIFTPLKMNTVIDIDDEKLGDTDPIGYMRYALSPLLPAPKEGNGWLFAAGELAMTPSDLARWDISIMDQKLMKPSSYKQLETEVLLANGVGTHYGLGVGVSMLDGHRAISHSGEVSGFTAENIVFPDDLEAVVVLTNEDASSAANEIAHGIASLLFAVQDSTSSLKLEQARKIFDGLQLGTIDRLLFTDNANYYFDDEALKDFASSLGPLGKPESFVQASQSLRGGMTERVYRIKFANSREAGSRITKNDNVGAGKTLIAITYEMPDGKLEEYQVMEQ